MTALIITLHILTCVSLIAIVLLQHGRGADIGAAFGAGASQTVFGGRGAGDFLTKLTTGAAIVFMLTSLSLSYFVGDRTVTELLDDEAAFEELAPEPEAEPEAPSTLPGASPIDESSAPEAESDVPDGFEEIPAPSGDAAN